MLPDAPSPAEPRSNSIHHKAAFYAIVAIVASFALNISLMSAIATAGPAGRFVSFGIGVVMLSAVPAGIIALCGIKKYGKRGLLWKGLVGVLVPILLTAAAIPAFLKVKNLSTQKTMEQAVAEFAKIAPRMVDEITRLDGAEISSKDELTVQYTITAFASGEIDKAKWASEFVPNVRKNIANTGLKQLLKRGIVVKLRYMTNDDLLFDVITLSSKDLSDASGAQPQ